MTHASLLSKLKSSYADYIEQSEENDGFPSIYVKSDNIEEFCRRLKSDPSLRFNFLSDIGGVDYLPQTPRFEVVYHLYSIPFKYRLRIKCKLAEGQEIPSVTAVWKTANWHEREAFDMYGIFFSDHPDLRRIYMWDDFEGYPQRKDFPLRGYKDRYNPYGDDPNLAEEDSRSNYRD